jgi:hypothetical protein
VPAYRATTCTYRCEKFEQEHWWVLQLSPTSKRQGRKLARQFLLVCRLGSGADPNDRLQSRTNLPTAAVRRPSNYLPTTDSTERPRW